MQNVHNLVVLASYAALIFLAIGVMTFFNKFDAPVK